MEVLNWNYSLNSCANKGKLFGVMFPNSDIAKNFQIVWTKASYIVYCGLVSHFKEVPHIVSFFDESYDNVMKKGQLDVLVRYLKVTSAKNNNFSKFVTWGTG